MKKRLTGLMGRVIIALALLAAMEALAGGGGVGAARGETVSSTTEPIVAGPRVRQDAEGEAEATPVVVPANVSWGRVEVLGILWTFVTAVVLGPVVMFFHKEPAKGVRQK